MQTALFEVTQLQYKGVAGCAIITAIPGDANESQLVESMLDGIHKGYHIQSMAGFVIGGTEDGEVNIPHVVITFAAGDTADYGNLHLGLLENVPDRAIEVMRYQIAPETVAVLYRS